MKAKQIIEKYQISRNTLSNWVKRGWIKIEKMPNGRYIYLDKKEEKEDGREENMH